MRTFPLDTYANRFLKRAFDIVFRIADAAPPVPVGLLIAIAIKLTSKGPVFFKTHRLGVTGAPFTIYKFRTHAINPTTDDQTLVHRRKVTIGSPGWANS